MQAAGGDRPSGQCRIQPAGLDGRSHRLLVEGGLSLGQGLLQSLAQAIGGGADGATLVQGERGQATEDMVEATAATQIGDPPALQGSVILGGGQIGAGPGLNIV
jgi:hypothetical protein